jgi:hypothetical protein
LAVFPLRQNHADGPAMMRLAYKPSNTAPANRHMVCRTHSVSLADFTDARREAIRPLKFRPENFDREFDSTTLFYDAVQVNDSQIAVFAPPFLNLQAELDASTFGRKSERYSTRARQLDRHAQVWIDSSWSRRPVRVSGSLGEFEFAISPNETELFRDCRVLFTMSKNNRIEWILDWVRFNRDIHGANAVLIYDNGSSVYDSATLSSALASVSGLLCSVVVEWPFPYGPQGSLKLGNWDSDFCQLGAWEHARWRFLQYARSVMNSDIDELVLSRTGQSIFEATERTSTGLLRYQGRWIIGTEDCTHKTAGCAAPRHFDFSTLMPRKYEFSRWLAFRDINVCPSKWTVVPGRCPAQAQWHVHLIRSWWASYLRTRRFCFRHFREIGSNWKYQRTSRVSFDPSIHQTDRSLDDAFQRVDWEI